MSHQVYVPTSCEEHWAIDMLQPQDSLKSAASVDLLSGSHETHLRYTSMHTLQSNVPSKRLCHLSQEGRETSATQQHATPLTPLPSWCTQAPCMHLSITATADIALPQSTPYFCRTFSYGLQVEQVYRPLWLHQS